MKHKLSIYFLLFLPSQIFAQAGVHEYFDWPNASSGGSSSFGLAFFVLFFWMASMIFLGKIFDYFFGYVLGKVGFLIGFFCGAPAGAILYIELFG